MATCRECLHQELCDTYSRMGVTDVSVDDITICELFKPKSDYVKRERGEWIKHKSDPKVMDEFHKIGIGRGMSRDSIFWTCSCCGTWGTPVHKFCSECGTDMRKEDNNG